MFPVVAMVIYSMMFVGPGLPPPPKTPRVLEAHAERALRAKVKSPKSVALPMVAIVM